MINKKTSKSTHEPRRIRFGFYPSVIIDTQGLVISEQEAEENELAHRDGDKRLAAAKRTASYWRNMNIEPGAKVGLDRLQTLTSISLLVRGQKENETPEQAAWRQRWQYEWCLHYFRPICSLQHGIVVGENSEHFETLISRASLFISQDANLLALGGKKPGLGLLLCDEVGWTGIVDHLEFVFR